MLNLIMLLQVINKCHVHYELSHGNKGFEGLHLYEADNGEQFLMGLCEGELQGWDIQGAVCLEMYHYE